MKILFKLSIYNNICWHVLFHVHDFSIKKKPQILVNKSEWENLLPIQFINMSLLSLMTFWILNWSIEGNFLSDLLNDKNYNSNIKEVL